jgi:hypothetical protein
MRENVMAGKFLVEFHPEFYDEFKKLPEAVQDALLVELVALKEVGPNLDRPHSGTLNNAKHKNLKELRFKADGGIWRVPYAFDPLRKAILLVAGDKSGVPAQSFYKRLIAKAVKRFDEYLEQQKQEKPG